jgi:Tol biopolymer transport system component
MIKAIFHFLVLILLFISEVKAQSQAFEFPPALPELIRVIGINTSLNERDFALTPDGNELYFTVSTPKSTFQTIVFCKRQKNGGWSAPRIVSFAGMYSDLEPALSADGNTLYFSSNRPLEGKEVKDFDLWRVKRSSNGWGIPEHLGNTINTEVDEFYPSITNNGNLYFTAQYKGGVGREDIYMVPYVNGEFQKPIVLDTAVNSKMYEFNAFVAPDESFILFTSYGRKDDMGGGDLYISVKDPSNRWKKAVNLKEINSAQLDYCPFVSSDGKVLFFTSERHHLPATFKERIKDYQVIKSSYEQTLNGTGNIYWVDWKKLIDYYR